MRTAGIARSSVGSSCASVRSSASGPSTSAPRRHRASHRLGLGRHDRHHARVAVGERQDRRARGAEIHRAGDHQHLGRAGEDVAVLFDAGPLLPVHGVGDDADGIALAGLRRDGEGLDPVAADRAVELEEGQVVHDAGRAFAAALEDVGRVGDRTAYAAVGHRAAIAPAGQELHLRHVARGQRFPGRRRSARRSGRVRP